MISIFSRIGNQKGSVIAIALMVMMTLLIVGLMSINDTIVESAIARNHTIHRQNFYLAEAAVRQAAQLIEDYRDDPSVVGELTARPRELPWMRHKLDFDFGADVDFGDFRGDGGYIDYGSFVPTMLANGNENASGFMARYEGPASGVPIDMNEPTNVYQFSVYGRGVGPTRNDADEVVVKIGYRVRF
ncbi:MAG: pilus assembly PilX N-terminal domain-containing protein [Thermodesulfobacteriota bacterium]